MSKEEGNGEGNGVKGIGRERGRPRYIVDIAEKTFEKQLLFSLKPAFLASKWSIIRKVNPQISQIFMDANEWNYEMP